MKIEKPTVTDRNMKRKLAGTSLIWAGIALAITTIMLWFIAKLLLANASPFNPPSLFALAVALLFFITFIGTCVTLLAGAVCKALGR